MALASCAPVTEQLSLGAGAPRSCPYCDMHGASLANQDLTDANLQGANLAGADLHGAILDGAMLARADLTRANLAGARLGRSARGVADLSGANLEGANLTGAKLDKTDLEYARLTGVSGLDTANAVIQPAPSSLAANAVNCGKADLSGLKAMMFVATPTGSDGPSCGDASAPCATIQKGIDRCAGVAACGVIVLWGHYKPAATVQLADGVNVYGCTTQPGSDALQVLVEAPPNGVPAMSAKGLPNGVIVQGFKIVGSVPPGSDSVSSIAFSASSSDNVKLIDTRVIGATGGAGVPGAGGAEGAAGQPGFDFNSGKQPACPLANGGDGAQKQGATVKPGMTFTCERDCTESNIFCRGYTSVGGARGGEPGNGDCPRWNYPRPQFGQRGQPGRDSNACGPGGKAISEVKGEFAGTQWRGSVATDGAEGGPGSGGGGGGAGGYGGPSPLVAGERGGGGGSGSCGGKGGRGGRQGGGSFAIVLDGSNLKLVRSTVVGGAGGAGGIGGPGGSGGMPGQGWPGQARCRGPAACGGDGGWGGRGAGGGGGGGGNGGPAVGVALTNGSSVFADAESAYYTGASSSPGAGGRSGPGPCASLAETGKAGYVADKANY
jgi:hypothetical protein